MGVKVTYRGERFTVEAELGDQPGEAGLFRAVANIVRAVETEPCGVCGSEDVKPSCRKGGDNDFLELVCQAAGCGAQLPYHQYREGGGTYIKRYEGKNGWFIYEGGGKKDTPYSQPADAPVSAPPGSKTTKNPF